MKDTIFLKEITVVDTSEDNAEVQLLIFKDVKSNGVFGIDSSFIEQNFNNDEEIQIIEPINNTKVTLDI